MSVQASIETKLQQHYSPEFLSVENESHMHSGPAAESHFKVTVVTSRFTSLRSVARHQEIYQLLQDELQAGVHALALHTYSPEEWRSKNATAPDSPHCRGGSKQSA